MPGKALFQLIKRIIKQIPGVPRLLRIKGKFQYDINRIRLLSALIQEKKFVILHPYSNMGDDEIPAREKIRKAWKEWIGLYGIVRLRRTTASAIAAPERAVLLYDPISLLKIPSSYEEYLAQVGHNSRQMIRKAERQGYEFKEFVWNDHLNEIYEINTSKEIRQNLPMLGWYGEPVQPRNHSNEELQYLKYYGAFKERKLWAYIHLWMIGDFAAPMHIMGHAHHLTYGIMNGLVSYTVQKCIENTQIRWLYYGNYIEDTSLVLFKKHVGFRGYATLLDLDGDKELLKYSERKIKTWLQV